MKYIGIGFKRDLAKGINIYLYNSMISIVFWIPSLKRPKYYHYKGEEYIASIEDYEFNKPMWFIGIII